MSICDDEQPNLSDFSRASTPSSKASTGTISALAVKWRKKLLDYHIQCTKCRTYYQTFPEDRSDYSFYITKVKKHLKTPHRNMLKRVATESASAEKPSTKTRVNSPEPELPKKLTIRPKTKDPRTEHSEQIDLNLSENSAITHYNRASANVSDSCEKTLPGDKQHESVAKNLTNEFETQEDTSDMDTHEEQEQVYTTPRKTVNLARSILNNSPTEEATVLTKNRFEPLQNLEQEPATSSAQAPLTRTAEPSRKTATATASTSKRNIPPPIVIVGKDNGTLTASLDVVTSGNYWVKNTANSVIIHTQNTPDYDATIRALNDAKLHYHTYTTNGRKTHAFVLRGMAEHHTVEQVQEDLKNKCNVEVVRAFKMRTKGAPLFLIVTSTNWNVNKLNKEVPRVLRTAVQWENRRSSNPITQCRRCQTWGHSMGNCTRTLRCSKCAETHPITECQHQGKPVCANCKGEHRAFSRQCPIYEAKLSQYLDRFPEQKKKPQYAPPPPRLPTLPGPPTVSPKARPFYPQQP